MTKWTKVKNIGFVAQVVPVLGGTITVKAGREVKVENLLQLSDKQVAHYKGKGVTFSSLRSKTKAEADAKIKAEADAKAKVEADAKVKAGGSGNE